MKAHVAVYDSHEKAVEAIQKLNASNFEMKRVSLLGKAENTDHHIHFKNLEAAKNSPVLVGTGAGIVLGLLTGLGVLAIPGFGFLYGAGAIVGAFGGFDIGLIAGGIGTLFATVGLKEDHIEKLREHLEEGNYLVIVKGQLEEIEQAEHILHTEGTHLEYFH